MHAVALSGTVTQPVVLDAFELRTSSTDPSEQAVDLAKHLSAKLTLASHERAAIRVAGTPPVARRNKAAFSRAHCEGAMLFVLREKLSAPVIIVDPASAPKAVGLKKAELEELVASLASKGVSSDAVLAALVALTHA